MQLFELAVLCLFLGVISYQDIKSRYVHVYNYIGLFICSVLYVRDIKLVFFNISINSILVILIFSLVYLYYKLIKKDDTSFLDNKIGIGDLFFLIAITPLFHILYFIVYMNTSFILILIINYIYTKYNENKHLDTIPLAGYMSSILILLLLLVNLYKINLADLYSIDDIFNI